MKTLIMLSLITGLVGCANPAIIKNSFPEPPAKMMVPPVDLKTIRTIDKETLATDHLPSNIPLSEIAKIITENYTQYNITKEQLIALQKWVADQKKLNP